MPHDLYLDRQDFVNEKGDYTNDIFLKKISQFLSKDKNSSPKLFSYIKNEYAFQALLQGLLTGLNAKGQPEIRVFQELNLSQHGRIDLVISILPSRSAQVLDQIKTKVIVFELKYFKGKHITENKWSAFIKQVSKYSENLKTLTDLKTAKLQVIVYCASTGAEEKVIENSPLLSISVDHSSHASHVERVINKEARKILVINTDEISHVMSDISNWDNKSLKELFKKDSVSPNSKGQGMKVIQRLCAIYKQLDEIDQIDFILNLKHRDLEANINDIDFAESVFSTLPESLIPPKEIKIPGYNFKTYLPRLLEKLISSNINFELNDLTNIFKKIFNTLKEKNSLDKEIYPIINISVLKNKLKNSNDPSLYNFIILFIRYKNDKIIELFDELLLLSKITKNQAGEFNYLIESGLNLPNFNEINEILPDLSIANNWEQFSQNLNNGNYNTQFIISQINRKIRDEIKNRKSYVFQNVNDILFLKKIDFCFNVVEQIKENYQWLLKELKLFIRDKKELEIFLKTIEPDQPSTAFFQRKSNESLWDLALEKIVAIIHNGEELRDFFSFLAEPAQVKLLLHMRIKKEFRIKIPEFIQGPEDFSMIFPYLYKAENYYNDNRHFFNNYPSYSVINKNNREEFSNPFIDRETWLNWLKLTKNEISLNKLTDLIKKILIFKNENLNQKNNRVPEDIAVLKYIYGDNYEFHLKNKIRSEYDVALFEAIPNLSRELSEVLDKLYEENNNEETTYNQEKKELPRRKIRPRTIKEIAHEIAEFGFSNQNIILNQRINSPRDLNELLFEYNLYCIKKINIPENFNFLLYKDLYDFELKFIYEVAAEYTQTYGTIRDNGQNEIAKEAAEEAAKTYTDTYDNLYKHLFFHKYINKYIAQYAVQAASNYANEYLNPSDMLNHANSYIVRCMENYIYLYDKYPLKKKLHDFATKIFELFYNNKFFDENFIKNKEDSHFFIDFLYAIPTSYQNRLTEIHILEEKLSKLALDDYKNFLNYLKQIPNKPLVKPIKREVVTVSHCLAAKRRRIQRSVMEGCLFDWIDIDEFNEEKIKSRDLKAIRINGKKFVDALQKMPTTKQAQLIQLASELLPVENNQHAIQTLIQNQGIKHHLQKINFVSGYLGNVLWGKDLLRDVLQADFKDTAINLASFAGNHISDKLSHAVLAQGQEWALSGKKLLGNAFKFSSPFLHQWTSAFTIADLIQQTHSKIQTQQVTHENSEINIIRDEFSLSMDTIKVGARLTEAFELLEEAALITGFANGADIIVLIGVEIFQAVKQVDHINHLIHLTKKERLVEGVLAFIGMSPEENIQTLLEKKEYNSLLVKQGFGYLEKHPAIQNYFFPTSKLIQDCHSVPYQTSECVSGGFNGGCLRTKTVTRLASDCTQHTEVDLDNNIYLDRKQTNFYWDRARPDIPQGGSLLCFPTAIASEELASLSYECHQAIGIADISKSSNITIIDVGSGDDEVIGFPHGFHLISSSDGHKYLEGGDEEDVFLLQGNIVSGYLDGRAGINTLDVSAFAPTQNALRIDLNQRYLTHQGYEYKILELRHLQRLIGRKEKEDNIVCACDTVYVDGGGGKQENYDSILVSDLACDYQLQILLHPYTYLTNKASQGNFTYVIPRCQGNIYIDLDGLKSHPNIQDRFFLDYTSTQLESIHIPSDEAMLSVQAVHLLFRDTAEKSLNIIFQGLNEYSSLSLADHTVLRFFGKQIFILQKSSHTVEQIMTAYPALSRKFRAIMIIQSLADQAMVTIGYNGHDVLSNDPQYPSHLIGNRGENIYLIKPNQAVSNLAYLNPITLYHLHSDIEKETLDLREVIQLAKQLTQAEPKITILPSGEDDLKLSVRSSAADNSIFTEVIFKSAQRNPWYQRLQIIAHQIPFSIQNQGDWHLLPQPLIFSDEIQIIVIFPQDVEPKTRLEIPRKVGKLVLFRNGRNLTDLVITNAGFTHKEYKFFSIVLKNFSQEPKLHQLTISFKDQTLFLNTFLLDIEANWLKVPLLSIALDKIYHAIHGASLKNTSVTPSRTKRAMESNPQPSLADTNFGLREAYQWLFAKLDKIAFSHRTDHAIENNKKRSYTSIETIDTSIDFNSTLLLTDLFLAKYKNRKIYAENKEAFLTIKESQALALTILEKFEDILKTIAKEFSLGTQSSTFNPSELFSTIVKQLTKGDYNCIFNTLYVSAKTIFSELTEENVRLRLKSQLEAIVYPEIIQYLEKQSLGTDRSLANSSFFSRNRLTTRHGEYKVQSQGVRDRCA